MIVDGSVLWDAAWLKFGLLLWMAGTASGYGWDNRYRNIYAWGPG